MFSNKQPKTRAVAAEACESNFELVPLASFGSIGLFVVFDLDGRVSI